MMIERFGGSDGVRDAGMLESAVNSAFMTFDGRNVHGTYGERACAIMRGVCVDHPFVDGNKRTALGCWWLYLRRNGFRLVGNEHDAQSMYTTVMMVANGSMSNVNILSMRMHPLVRYVGKSDGITTDEIIKELPQNVLERFGKEE